MQGTLVSVQGHRYSQISKKKPQCNLSNYLYLTDVFSLKQCRLPSLTLVFLYAHLSRVALRFGGHIPL